MLDDAALRRQSSFRPGGSFVERNGLTLGGDESAPAAGTSIALEEGSFRTVIFNCGGEWIRPSIGDRSGVPRLSGGLVKHPAKTTSADTHYSMAA